MKHTDSERSDTAYLNRIQAEQLGDPLHAAVLRELRPKSGLRIPPLTSSTLSGGSSDLQPSSSRSVSADQQTIELSPADVIALEGIGNG